MVKRPELEAENSIWVLGNVSLHDQEGDGKETLICILGKMYGEWRYSFTILDGGPR
jgi:hypothetical protein